MTSPISFKGVLLDAYGVFWGGNATGPFEGAKEQMQTLMSQGVVVGVLSNATQLAEKEIAKLKKHGIVQGEHFHFLITSGGIARDLFLNEELPFPTPQKKFWVFAGAHPLFHPHVAIFENTSYLETQNIDEADFIYIGVPHIEGEDQTDPHLFYPWIKAIKEKNLPMICANPDRFAHEGNPPKAFVRQGSIAEMYEKMGGKVYYIGKPYDRAYSLAMDHFRKHNIDAPKDILMIGDTPETDIRGARKFGMATALVTETGIAADRILHQGFVNAIKELPPSDSPDFLMRSLADGI